MQQEYKGHTITVDAGSLRFTVTGPHYDGLGLFESAREAREVIDKSCVAAIKTERVKLSLKVLGEHGEQITITGVHAGHGKLLGLPRDYRGHEVYPDTPTVAALITEYCRLEKIIRRLRKFSLSTSLLYVERDYDLAVANFLADVEKKTAAALAATLDDPT